MIPHAAPVASLLQQPIFPRRLAVAINTALMMKCSSRRSGLRHSRKISPLDKTFIATWSEVVGNLYCGAHAKNAQAGWIWLVGGKARQNMVGSTLPIERS